MTRTTKSIIWFLSISQQILDQGFDTTSTTDLTNSNEIEEHDPTIVWSNSHLSIRSIKAPIVIKMQPGGKSPSPQSTVSIQLADMTFEDKNGSDSDKITSKFVSVIDFIFWSKKFFLLF